MQQITLKADSGLGFTIGIDAMRHRLCLGARHDARGIDLAFEAQDGIDDLGLINVIWGPYNPVQGRKHFFHRASRLFQNADGSAEIRSCPVDAATGQPMAALVVHYRFEVVPGADALRIRGWFTRREPCTAGTLHWLNLTCVRGTFDTLRGFEPDCDYALASVPHALRFPALALCGGGAWAALTDCGEALYTPGKADPYEPQEHALPSTLRPQATTVHQVHLNLYGKASPLAATLVVGSGAVSLPRLPQPPALWRVTSAAPGGQPVTLPCGPLALTVINRADGCSLAPLDTGSWQPAPQMPGMAPLSRLLVKHLQSGALQTISTDTGWARSDVTPFDGGIRLYLSDPEGIEGFSLALEARAEGHGRIVWRCQVLNTNPDWTVLYAAYPALNVTTAHGAADDLCLFTPKDSGSIIAGPCRKSYHYNGVYPHGVETTMGYMGLYHAGGQADNGLYVGLHDPEGSRKEMTADFSTAGHGCFEFVYIAPNINRGANAFELPGTLVWQVFGGDWYDMAHLYRAFVHTQARWLPAFGRGDSPAWMRDVPFYIIDRMPPGDNPDNWDNPRSRALGQAMSNS